MLLQTENNAIGTIDGALASGSVTLTLQSMTGMPIITGSDFCILTLIRASDGAIEYVKATAQNIPARTYTVVRGQEGSSPLDFVDSDECRNLWTKGQIEHVDPARNGELVLRDGSVPFTGDVDAGGNKIENVADAVNPDEAPNLQQVQDLVDGVSVTDGTVLTTVDMTNGGANNWNSVDVTWQSAWDSYDFVRLIVEDWSVSNTGQFAWALSSDGGSTWESLTGGRQTFSPTSYSVGSIDGLCNCVSSMNIKGSTKNMVHGFFNVGQSANPDSENLLGGHASSYSGTSLTNGVWIGTWSGWFTGSDGLDTYTLRFTHEVGNFTSGTLKIVGYNYP